MTRCERVLVAAGMLITLAVAGAVVIAWLYDQRKEPREFDRIETGMTYSDVVNLLGGPGFDEQAVLPSSERFNCRIWRRGDLSLLVLFDEKALVSSRRTWKWPPPEPLLDRLQRWVGLAPPAPPFIFIDP